MISVYLLLDSRHFIVSHLPLKNVRAQVAAAPAMGV